MPAALVERSLTYRRVLVRHVLSMVAASSRACMPELHALILISEETDMFL